MADAAAEEDPDPTVALNATVPGHAGQVRVVPPAELGPSSAASSAASSDASSNTSLKVQEDDGRRRIAEGHGPSSVDGRGLLLAGMEEYCSQGPRSTARRDNHNAAIEVFTEVLNIKVADVGRMHPEVASAHKRIGNVHYQRGDLAAADGEYRKALSIYQHCCGAEHSTT